MRNNVSRRSFLGAAARGAAASAVASTAAWSAKSYASIVGANERIGVGVIGAGVIGTAHLNVLKDLREKNNLLPVAVADCWKTRADQGKELVGAVHSLTDISAVARHERNRLRRRGRLVFPPETEPGLMRESRPGVGRKGFSEDEEESTHNGPDYREAPSLICFIRQWHIARSKLVVSRLNG